MKKDRSVFVVGRDGAIEEMFAAQGWALSKVSETADLLCFTGGADVTPSLYGEPNTGKSYTNQQRDTEEIRILRERPFGKPAVGVCRGAQFLNVQAGGRMWQAVNGHVRGHFALDMNTGLTIQVTSTHHQMMRPSNLGVILMTAQESTRKEGAYEMVEGRDITPDIEAVYYPCFNYLCFQPHPEYVQATHDCQKVFFRLIADYAI